MTESNESLVIEYQKTKSGAAFQKLMDNNLGSVAKMALSFSQGGEDYEDFVQEGWIAFERAARKFENNKETKFITFATCTMKNQMIGFYKKNKAKFPTVPLEDESEEYACYDKPSGQLLDLDYALGKIPAFQRRSIMKVYFSKDSVNKSDLTMARMARISLKPILSDN